MITDALNTEATLYCLQQIVEDELMELDAIEAADTFNKDEVFSAYDVLDEQRRMLKWFMELLDDEIGYMDDDMFDIDELVDAYDMARNEVEESA